MLDELCEGKDLQILWPDLWSSRVSLNARRRFYVVRTTGRFLTELIALLSMLYLTNVCLAQIVEHLVVVRNNKFEKFLRMCLYPNFR